MQGGEEQTNESEETSQAEDDGTTLEDIKVRKMQFLSGAVLLLKFLICVSNKFRKSRFKTTYKLNLLYKLMDFIEKKIDNTFKAM